MYQQIKTMNETSATPNQSIIGFLVVQWIIYKPVYQEYEINQ
jgi:hypothetical protein